MFLVEGKGYVAKLINVYVWIRLFEGCSFFVNNQRNTTADFRKYKVEHRLSRLSGAAWRWI